MEFKEWFAAERARALAMVLLTRRDDLAVEEAKPENGLDYIVSIRNGWGGGDRPFGVVVRATMTPVTAEVANQQLNPTMADVQRLGPFCYPVCVFYFTAKDDRGYYTWAYEPIVNGDGQPRLQAHPEARCAALDDDALEAIVSTVNRWYDAFYATIMR